MIQCRSYEERDNQFLKEMFFEAVFWSRQEEDRPTLDEGLSYDYTKDVLRAFGERQGDIAVIAEFDHEYAGAAFIRYWQAKDEVRGYIDDRIPVLVIGVEKTYRRRGIGAELIEALKKEAVRQGIHKVSLCVTKTNIAYHLYEAQGFSIVEDIVDSYNMVWTY